MKLNLGCGLDIKKGYVNLDSVKLPGVEIIWDLDKTPYPFKNGTFEEIYASHVLEHVKDLSVTLDELCRISKKGGRLIVRVPYFSNPGAFGDPTHKRFFTYNTFDYFTSDGVLSYYTCARVEIKSRKIVLLTSKNPLVRIFGFVPQSLVDVFPSVYQRLFSYWLPAAELRFELEVVK